MVGSGGTPYLLYLETWTLSKIAPWNWKPGFPLLQSTPVYANGGKPQTWVSPVKVSQSGENVSVNLCSWEESLNNPVFEALRNWTQPACALSPLTPLQPARATDSRHTHHLMGAPWSPTLVLLINWPICTNLTSSNRWCPPANYGSRAVPGPGPGPGL